VNDVIIIIHLRDITQLAPWRRTWLFWRKQYSVPPPCYIIMRSLKFPKFETENHILSQCVFFLSNWLSFRLNKCICNCKRNISFNVLCSSIHFVYVGLHIQSTNWNNLPQETCLLTVLNCLVFTLTIDHAKSMPKSQVLPIAQEGARGRHVEPIDILCN